MANWTKDSVKELIETAIRKEQERLKRHNQKLTPDYLADFLATTILALMANARSRELQRALDAIQEGRDITSHLKERRHATVAMAQALQNYADKKEKERK